jgi:hypothetical protein
MHRSDTLKDEREAGDPTNAMKIFCRAPCNSAVAGTGLDVAARCALLDEAIEVHPDVGGFRGRIGKRDG